MTRVLKSNRIKFGLAHRRDTVEEYRLRLEWLAENPGEWLHWGSHPYAVRDLRSPAFERRIVRTDQSRRTGEAEGLWLRYRGIRACDDATADALGSS